MSVAAGKLGARLRQGKACEGQERLREVSRGKALLSFCVGLEGKEQGKRMRTRSESGVPSASPKLTGNEGETEITPQFSLRSFTRI